MKALQMILKLYAFQRARSWSLVYAGVKFSRHFTWLIKEALAGFGRVE